MKATGGRGRGNLRIDDDDEPTAKRAKLEAAAKKKEEEEAKKLEGGPWMVGETEVYVTEVEGRKVTMNTGCTFKKAEKLTIAQQIQGFIDTEMAENVLLKKE